MRIIPDIDLNSCPREEARARAARRHGQRNGKELTAQKLRELCQSAVLGVEAVLVKLVLGS